MPDQPTTSDGSGAADGAGPDDGNGSPWESDDNSVSPGQGPDDDYRWYGPSPHSYPGAEAHIPYGAYDPQYGAYRTREYGRQGPYSEQGSHGPGPYSQQMPYGGPGPYGQQTPYGQQSPYAPPQSPPFAWPYVPPARARAPLSPEERRRRTRRALAFAGVLVIAVGAGIGIGAEIAPTTPAATARNLVNSAISAATKAGSYHYVERSTALGVPDDIKGDAAPNGGRQVILQRCSGGTTFFHLRLVNGVVYFNGTRTAVLDQLGVPPARASSAAGKWVKVVKGDKIYSTLADGITTRSNISQLHGALIPLSTKKTQGSSTEVLGALSRAKHRLIGTAALVLDSAGRPTSLRGSASTTTGNHYVVAWTFSRYGESVPVKAPPNAVPYGSLHATPTKTLCR